MGWSEEDIRKDQEEYIKDLIERCPYELTPVPPGEYWDGFIDPQGNFYESKPRGISYWNSSCNCHREWAIHYLATVDPFWKDTKKHRDPVDYLVLEMRWISYGYIQSLGEVHVETHKYMTKAQKDTLFKLFELNKDDMKKYFEIIGDKN